MALALLPVDGAHAASWEEMATEMSSAEAAAYKGLQQCIETVMAEVERLSSAEQKATDYRSRDDGLVPDHRPRNACRRMASVFMAAPESLSTLFEGTPSISTDAQRKVVFLLMGMFCLAGVWVYSTQRGLQERKTCIQSQLLLDKL